MENKVWTSFKTFTVALNNSKFHAIFLRSDMIGKEEKAQNNMKGPLCYQRLPGNVTSFNTKVTPSGEKSISKIVKLISFVRNPGNENETLM